MEKIWENIMQGLGVVVLVLIIAFFVKASTADTQIRSYYLENYCGQVIIKGDIDWRTDITIEVDRSITLDSAIVLVERLNQTLLPKK